MPTTGLEQITLDGSAPVAQRATCTTTGLAAYTFAPPAAALCVCICVLTVSRWQIKDDGYHDPNIRVLVKPVLNLFHGDRGGKRWKNAVDGVLKDGGLKSVTELFEKTLAQIPDEILDAPPRSSQEAALIVGNGTLPPAFSLPERLAQPVDRARGENERRKGGKKQQQQETGQQQTVFSAALLDGSSDVACNGVCSDAAGIAVVQQHAAVQLDEEQHQAAVAAVGA